MCVCVCVCVTETETEGETERETKTERQRREPTVQRDLTVGIRLYDCRRQHEQSNWRPEQV